MSINYQKKNIKEFGESFCDTQHELKTILSCLWIFVCESKIWPICIPIEEDEPKRNFNLRITHTYDLCFVVCTKISLIYEGFQGGEENVYNIITTIKRGFVGLP